MDVAYPEDDIDGSIQLNLLHINISKKLKFKNIHELQENAFIDKEKRRKIWDRDFDGFMLILKEHYNLAAELIEEGKLEEAFMQHSMFVETADMLNFKLSHENFLEQVKNSSNKKLLSLAFDRWIDTLNQMPLMIDLLEDRYPLYLDKEFDFDPPVMPKIVKLDDVLKAAESGQTVLILDYRSYRNELIYFEDYVNLNVAILPQELIYKNPLIFTRFCDSLPISTLSKFCRLQKYDQIVFLGDVYKSDDTQFLFGLLKIHNTRYKLKADPVFLDEGIKAWKNSSSEMLCTKKEFYMCYWSEEENLMLEGLSRLFQLEPSETKRDASLKRQFIQPIKKLQRSVNLDRPSTSRASDLAFQRGFLLRSPEPPKKAIKVEEAPAKFIIEDVPAAKTKTAELLKKMRDQPMDFEKLYGRMHKERTRLKEAFNKGVIISGDDEWVKTLERLYEQQEAEKEASQKIQVDDKDVEDGVPETISKVENLRLAESRPPTPLEASADEKITTLDDLLAEINKTDEPQEVIQTVEQFLKTHETSDRDRDIISFTIQSKIIREMESADAQKGTDASTPEVPPTVQSEDFTSIVEKLKDQKEKLQKAEERLENIKNLRAKVEDMVKNGASPEEIDEFLGAAYQEILASDELIFKRLEAGTLPSNVAEALRSIMSSRGSAPGAVESSPPTQGPLETCELTIKPPTPFEIDQKVVQTPQRVDETPQEITPEALARQKEELAKKHQQLVAEKCRVQERLEEQAQLKFDFMLKMIEGVMLTANRESGLEKLEREFCNSEENKMLYIKALEEYEKREIENRQRLMSELSKKEVTSPPGVSEPKESHEPGPSSSNDDVQIPKTSPEYSEKREEIAQKFKYAYDTIEALCSLHESPLESLQNFKKQFCTSSENMLIYARALEEFERHNMMQITSLKSKEKELLKQKTMEAERLREERKKKEVEFWLKVIEKEEEEEVNKKTLRNRKKKQKKREKKQVQLEVVDGNGEEERSRTQTPEPETSHNLDIPDDPTMENFEKETSPETYLTTSENRVAYEHESSYEIPEPEPEPEWLSEIRRSSHDSASEPMPSNDMTSRQAPRSALSARQLPEFLSQAPETSATKFQGFYDTSFWKDAISGDITAQMPTSSVALEEPLNEHGPSYAQIAKEHVKLPENHEIRPSTSQAPFTSTPTIEEKVLEVLKKLAIGNKDVPTFLQNLSKIQAFNYPSQQPYFRKIEEDSIGHGYYEIFERCLDDKLTEVIVEDPWIWEPYQIRNFALFVSTIKKYAQNLQKIFLDTSAAPDLRTLNIQRKMLKNVSESLNRSGLQIKIRYKDFHDREFWFNNGWHVIIGRGLDIYKRVELESLEHYSPELRPCKATKVCYIRLNK